MNRKSPFAPETGSSSRPSRSVGFLHWRSTLCTRKMRMQTSGQTQPEADSVGTSDHENEALRVVENVTNEIELVRRTLNELDSLVRWYADAQSVQSECADTKEMGRAIYRAKAASNDLMNWMLELDGLDSLTATARERRKALVRDIHTLLDRADAAHGALKEIPSWHHRPVTITWNQPACHAYGMSRPTFSDGGYPGDGVVREGERVVEVAVCSADGEGWELAATPWEEFSRAVGRAVGVPWDQISFGQHRLSGIQTVYDASRPAVGAASLVPEDFLTTDEPWRRVAKHTPPMRSIIGHCRDSRVPSVIQASSLAA